MRTHNTPTCTTAVNAGMLATILATDTNWDLPPGVGGIQVKRPMIEFAVDNVLGLAKSARPCSSYDYVATPPDKIDYNPQPPAVRRERAHVLCRAHAADPASA